MSMQTNPNNQLNGSNVPETSDSPPGEDNSAAEKLNVQSSLNDFFIQLDDYQPTIPDRVTQHYLESAGMETSDPRLVRMISISAQKFLTDLVQEAMTHAKLQSVPTNNRNTTNKDKNLVLTFDNLSAALKDHGIDVVKPPYIR